MDEDLAKILDENNLLQAGTLPAVHAATEAGEKALLAFYDEGAAMAKRAAKPRKDKEAPGRCQGDGTQDRAAVAWMLC